MGATDRAGTVREWRDGHASVRLERDGDLWRLAMTPGGVTLFESEERANRAFLDAVRHLRGLVAWWAEHEVDDGRD